MDSITWHVLVKVLYTYEIKEDRMFSDKSEALELVTRLYPGEYSTVLCATDERYRLAYAYHNTDQKVECFFNCENLATALV